MSFEKFRDICKSKTDRTLNFLFNFRVTYPEHLSLL